jgi:hypothetical protein
VKRRPLPAEEPQELNGHAHDMDELYRHVRPNVTSAQSTYAWLEERRGSQRYFRTGDRTNAPNKYRDYMPEMAYHLRLLGAKNKDIAAAFDTTPQTVDSWRREKPEFAEAWIRGGDMADARVAASMYERALGYSHHDVKVVSTKEGVQLVPIIKHYPPDPSAGQFWLTNRQRDTWRNRQSTELTGPDGDPLVPPQLVVTPVASPHSDEPPPKKSK